MLFPPASVILSWPNPNYVDPVRRGPELFIFYAIFLTLATLAVGIRLYTRIVIRRWFGADDFFIVLAFCLNIFVVFIVLNGVINLDWDRHMWDVKLPNFEPGSKYIFIFKIVWATASASIRLSLLSFFYRLLGHIELRRYNWVLHFNLFLVIAIWLCLVMTTVFNDTPIPAYWQFPQPPASRQLQEADSFAILSAFNTFSEIFIAALPIPLIFGKRHLPVLQRWSVVGLLCVGFLVGVVGIVRSYFCYVVFQNYDHSWWAEPYLISSEIELDTALICACAPALRPFFSRVFGSSDTRARRIRTPPRRGSAAASGTRKTLSSLWGSEKHVSQVSELSSHPSMNRVFDLEGIQTHGFGYKVTITATPRARSSYPGRKRSLCGLGADGASDSSDIEAAIGPKWHPLTVFSKRHSEPKHGTVEDRGLRVHTTQSVEVRKSYYEDPAEQSDSGGMADLSPEDAAESLPQPEKVYHA